MVLKAKTYKAISTIRNWEGDKVEISRGDMQFLADVLGVNADWLRTGTEPKHPAGGMHKMLAAEPEVEYGAPIEISGPEILDTSSIQEPGDSIVFHKLVRAEDGSPGFFIKHVISYISLEEGWKEKEALGMDKPKDI